MILNKIKEKLYPFKKILVSLFHYPKMEIDKFDYNNYWQHRNLSIDSQLNSFQKKRADLVLQVIEKDSVIIDIGCGDGGVLSYIHKEKPMKELIGVDTSNDALLLAEKKDIKIIQMNVSNKEALKELPLADYIFLFEVIEHVSDSEELIKWAVEHSKKGVFFSVPNTGFIGHRLRLLFGSFPLQWRIHPSEHLRFWTLRDMQWWLKSLGYINSKIHMYEGLPLFNKIWSSLFAQGIFIRIKTNQSK